MTESNNNHIENKGGRPKKSSKYYEERQDIIKKLNNILGITSINNSFYIYELDNNIEKQKQILDLKRDIKEYFPCSKWAVYNNSSKLKKEYISLIRSVYKYMNYEITYKSITIKNNENKIPTIIYFINKKPLDIS